MARRIYRHRRVALSRLYRREMEGWVFLRARAEELAEEALRIGSEADQHDARLIYGAQLTRIRFYQGRGAELVELKEQRVAGNPGLPSLRAGLAQVLCWLDRTEDATAIVTDAARDGFDHVGWDYPRLSTLALYAEAAAMAGVRDAAVVLYELIEPWAERFVYRPARFPTAMRRSYLGLLAATLGWDERADEHFALSCEFHEANALWLWAARAHLGWAEALAKRGDSSGARAHAARAP